MAPSLKSAANAPAGEREERIVAICRRLLKNPGFQATDNFFDAGGHSLLAMTLMLEIERELGIASTRLEAVFGAPTVRALCLALAQPQPRTAAMVLPIKPGPATLYVVHSAFNFSPMCAALPDELGVAFVGVDDLHWLRRNSPTTMPSASSSGSARPMPT